MKKFKYLKFSSTKKIRYLNFVQKNSAYIVFLHGFMSDLEGKKPKSLLNFAKKNKLSFLALEYSGHGKSSGKFVDGNISKWTRDTKVLISKIVKKNNFILVGSSMGSWISLNLIKFFKKQVVGFLGIGSAPEFLENLMWKKCPSSRGVGHPSAREARGGRRGGRGGPARARESVSRGGGREAERGSCPSPHDDPGGEGAARCRREQREFAPQAARLRAPCLKVVTLSPDFGHRKLR